MASADVLAAMHEYEMEAKPPVVAATSEGELPSQSVDGLLQLARPLCRRCKLECDPFKCQIKGKNGGIYTCNQCHTKQVLLSKMFDSGIPAEFRALSEAEQTAFYRSAKDKTTAEQLKCCLADTLVRRKVERVSASVCGTYLPLSVYAQRGFDADRIARTCTDVQEHAILGTTYRVSLTSLDKTAVEEQARTEVMTVLNKKTTPHLKVKAALEPATE